VSASTVFFGIAAGGLALALASPPPRLRQVVKQRRLVRSPLLMALVGVEVFALIVRSPTLSIATPVAAFMGYRAYLRLRDRRSRQRLQAALPAFTDELAQQLRSGASLSGSFVRVARESPHIIGAVQPAVQALDAGERMEVALQRLESDDEILRLVLLTIRILVTTGGPAAETVERMGENVRAVIAGEEEAKALAGQGTASALVLAVLPIAIGAVAAFTSTDVARLYAYEWIGAVCVSASLLLTGAAWFWMDSLLWGKK
jgi:Flp pilus assembly protein TadB